MAITRRGLMAASAALMAYLPAAARGQSKNSVEVGGGTLFEDLAMAYQILVNQEVVDGYGHVSVRDPANPNRYFIGRDLAPALMTASDIMTFDLDSVALNGDKRNPVSERYIHGEIYKARPDVQSVVHTHAVPLIPFTVVKIPLRAIWQMSGFIGNGLPVFDPRGVREPSDKGTTIHTAVLGKAMAQTLGDKPAVLLRGHGAAVVGPNLTEAVGRTVYLKDAAIVQMHTMALSKDIDYMDPEEADARLRGDTNASGAPYHRDWEFWKHQVMTRRS